MLAFINNAPRFNVTTAELAGVLAEFFGDLVGNYAFTDTHIGSAPDRDGKLVYKIAYHIDTKDTMASVQRSFPLSTLVAKIGKLAKMNDIQVFFLGEKSLLTITPAGSDNYVVSNIDNEFEVIELTPVRVSEPDIKTEGLLELNVDIAANVQSGPDVSGKPNTVIQAEMPMGEPLRVTTGVTEGVHPRPFSVTVDEVGAFDPELVSKITEQGQEIGRALVGTLPCGKETSVDSTFDTESRILTIDIKTVQEPEVQPVTIQASDENLPNGVTRVETEVKTPEVEMLPKELVVGRYQEGITINNLEYILDEEGRIKRFPNEEAVHTYLEQFGISIDDVTIREYDQETMGGLLHISVESVAKP